MAAHWAARTVARKVVVKVDALAARRVEWRAWRWAALLVELTVVTWATLKAESSAAQSAGGSVGH